VSTASAVAPHPAVLLQAALLARGRAVRQAKLLFYAKLAEKGLSTYERDGWGEFPTQVHPERREIRPTADRGPILLCVDTSGGGRCVCGGGGQGAAKVGDHCLSPNQRLGGGCLGRRDRFWGWGWRGSSRPGSERFDANSAQPACITAAPCCQRWRCVPAPAPLHPVPPFRAGSMRGPREVVAKALALECMRAAKAQDRACYVYAFAGPQEVCVCVWGGAGGGCKGC
jgi:hypothetical protein